MARVVLYLAVGPGLFGHTVLNYLLKHLSPLVVSIAVTLEPAVGSVIGWAWGLESPPGVSTWFGGVIMLASLVAVAYGHHHRTREGQRPVYVTIGEGEEGEGSIVDVVKQEMVLLEPRLASLKAGGGDSGMSTPAVARSPRKILDGKQI